jgi:hypothetical protein
MVQREKSEIVCRRKNAQTDQATIGANRSSSHKDIEELTYVPLTDFWNRWLRRLLPSDGISELPNLRDAEKQRETTRRQATEELAAITTTPPPTAKPEDNSRS